jgi:hypothetical protein
MAAAALALLAGCATTWTVDRFEAAEADVAGQRSFAWKPGDVGTPTEVPAAIIADTEARVREAVVDELLRKGYAESAQLADADLVVTYQVAGTRRFVLSEERRVGAPSPNELLTPGGMPLPPASDLPREQVVRDGTVLLFVENRESGRLVWRGSITAETRVSSTEAGLRLVVDMARQIAQEFPARRATP